MLLGQMQHDAPADRAAHGRRPVQFERVGDLDDQPHIVGGAQLVFAFLPT
jgi:hypothetical protein